MKPRATRFGCSSFAIRALVAAVLLALPLHAAAATPPDDGPIILGKRERPPILTLDPFSGSIGLTAILGYDSFNSGGSTSNSYNGSFQETVSLATGGGVISKNFLDWHAAITAGLEENFAKSPTEEQSGLGIIDTYDIGATLLKTTILPSTYRARRTESYINRSFQPLLKQTFEEYGANISFQSPTVPTTLNVYRTMIEQSELTDKNPTFTLSEDHVEFQTSWEPTDRHHLDLNYEYVATSQDSPGETIADTASQNVALNHSWQLDGAGRYILTQSLNYSSQTGDFPFERLRLNELLRMRHTDDFETALNYSFDQQDYATSSRQSHQFAGSFTHRLFQSLTTHGQLGATASSSDFTDPTASGGRSFSSSDDSYFADIGWDYTKKIPYGVLGAKLGFAYNQTNNGAVGARQTVVNDLETFNDPQPIILTRAGVNPNSIAVYNARGTRQFLPGFDYIITRVGNTVEIERPITSNIDPNDTVRLSYDIDPLPGYSLTTSSFSAGARYDITSGPLDGLSVYGNYFQQEQSVGLSSAASVSDALRIRADNVTDILVGAQYKFWNITLQAENENRSSSLAPFDAQRFTARYADRLTDRSILSLTASQSFINYPLDGNSTSLTTLDGHLDYQISRELKASLNARFRNSTDDRFGNVMGFEEYGELRYRVRQTEIFLMLRHTAIDSSGSDSQSLFAQFGITRNF